jgi:hypothetical protein
MPMLTQAITINQVFFANWMSIIKMSPGIALFQILGVSEISSKNSELPA